ncbi:MAG: hypothetical protein AAEJ04_06090 [Planctomycetota bacterium]
MKSQSPCSDPHQQAAWIAYARTEWYQHLAGGFPGLIAKLGYTDSDHFNKAMHTCMSSSAEEMMHRILQPEIAPTITARELAAAFYIRRCDFLGLSPQEHSQYCRAVASHLPTNSPWHSYAIYLECLRVSHQGSSEHVQELIESRIDSTQREASGVISIWLDSLSRYVIGNAALIAGDFKSSHRELSEALRNAKGLDFNCATSIQFRLAQLYRESGQHDKALRMWFDEPTRATLRSNEDWARLATAHLNAAQCALDAKITDVAHTELESSHALMPLVASYAPRLLGYQYLREGELATLEERYEDGESRLREALDFFRELTPPCYEGLMETKIALGSYALYQNDLRMAWTIIRSLIEEAGEKNCLPMRSRALLLQSWFFISSDPPTRQSFDNVLERIHMIQNPALMMHALGNLLSYAVQNLEEHDQAHLLQRIRRLKSVLEDSCYEKLYQEHVADRFAPAMEERLDRLFQKEQQES